MKHHVLRVFLTLATALAFLGSAYAADAKPMADPELIMVTVVKIKPGMAKQWEEVQGQITNAFQKSGVRFRAVWQNYTIGDLNTYATVTPLSKFADLDGESPYVKNVPEEQRQKNSEILSQSTMEVKRFILRSRPDLSIGQMNSLPSTPMQLIRVQVAPGRTIDYETLAKNELLPAAKKGGAEVVMAYQVVMGDRTPQYHFVIGMNKFADFDGPNPIVKALGKPGADKLSAKFAGISMGSESSIMRVRPDISFMMKPADKSAASGE